MIPSLERMLRRVGNPAGVGPGQRVAAIDSFRGAVMLLMVAEALRLARLPRFFPESDLAAWLAHHQSHVAWSGMSLHDLIQPGFCFLVGLALPYSLAARRGRGQSVRDLWLHAARRACILTGLGVLLRALYPLLIERRLVVTFEDTLSQIGLGYLALFAIGQRSNRAVVVCVLGVLVAAWSAFVLFPLPGAGFDYAAVGVPDDWPHHRDGLAAHWNKNSNLGAAVDRVWLNLFPQSEPFRFNRGDTRPSASSRRWGRCCSAC